MAFYRDQTKKINLVDALIQKLTAVPAGATEPYWTLVQSGTYAQEGYVLYSKGSSGKDNIWIRMSANSLGVIISLIEQYTPNAVSGLVGTVVNESVKQIVQYYASGSYGDTAPVHYILSFDKDKIMLVLRGLAAANSTSFRVLAYVGLPERLDPTDDSTAAVLAVSRSAWQLTNLSSAYEGLISQCKVLRARDKSAQSTMNMVTLGAWKTKGWGDINLLSHIYLQDDSGMEGIRSRMSSIHPIFQDNLTYPEFRDGDEITVGSKRYLVLQTFETSWNTNYDNISSFPAVFMAIEQL